MAENQTPDANDAGQSKEADELNAALGSLRDAIERLGAEIETSAREEWVRAKPEVMKTLGDLQRMVDAAAERAKELLEDLSNRIDRDAGENQG
jgi:hypothetical protein